MHTLYRSSQDAARLRAWFAERIERWPVPHAASRVGARLGQTALTCAGDADRVCLLLPEGGLSTALCLDLATELAASFRVVVTDLPGHPGLSSADRLAGREARAGYACRASEVPQWLHSSRPAAKVLVVGHGLWATVALIAPPEQADALLRYVPLGPAPERSRRRSTEGFVDGLEEWRALVAATTSSDADAGPVPGPGLEAGGHFGARGGRCRRRGGGGSRSGSGDPVVARADVDAGGQQADAAAPERLVPAAGDRGRPGAGVEGAAVPGMSCLR